MLRSLEHIRSFRDNDGVCQRWHIPIVTCAITGQVYFCYSKACAMSLTHLKSVQCYLSNYQANLTGN